MAGGSAPIWEDGLRIFDCLNCQGLRTKAFGGRKSAVVSTAIEETAAESLEATHAGDHTMYLFIVSSIRVPEGRLGPFDRSPSVPKRP